MTYFILIIGISFGAVLSYRLRDKRKRQRLESIRENEKYLIEKKKLSKKIKVDNSKHGLRWDPTRMQLEIWEEAEMLMAMNTEEKKAYEEERERKFIEGLQEARKKELKKLDRGDNISLTPEEKKRKVMLEEAIERDR
tara:strand:- start:598 stop:1011 length:414 start_codon:yes stop_codon:yes gene_type:complete